MTDERRIAERLLDGLENGGLPSRDAGALAEELDPVLVYVIVSFLRAVYPAGAPAAGSVLERVVGLTENPVARQKYQDGRSDPISRWAESEHPYADFRGRGRELIALVAEKLD